MNGAESALVDEEYKVWRKNVPQLYDMVYTQLLKWPSPTVQWFPSAERIENKATAQRLLMATYTGDTDKEHLLFAQAFFPDMVDEDTLNNADIKFKFTQSIPVSADINKARFSPFASNIVACRTTAPEVLIYDYTRHSSANSSLGPDAILEGHSAGGFALDWNSLKFGQLATGGEDSLVNIFDINSGSCDTLTVHSAVVNDVSFSHFNPNQFCSVSDDRRLVIHDLRSKDAHLTVEKAHHKVIDACAFSPLRAELLATAAGDNAVKIWDIRSTDSPSFILRGHKDGVNVLKWSPHYESVLASGGKDRRVIIWDLNKSEIECGPDSPELLFVHGGHTAVVDDLDWNPTEPMEIASVASDNHLHIWKISIENYL